MNKNKKGLSGVVTSIILIGLTLVAVGVVWFVLQTAIQEEKESIEAGSSRIDIKIKEALVEETGLGITLERKIGKGNLTKIKFIVTNIEDDSETYEIETNLKELSRENFKLDLQGLGEVAKVAVAPVIKTDSGKDYTLGITDEIYFDAEGNVYEGCVPNCESASEVACGEEREDLNNCKGDCGTGIKCDEGYSCLEGECVSDVSCAEMGGECKTFCDGENIGDYDCGLISDCCISYVCLGGDEIYDENGYRYHVFKSSGTFQIVGGNWNLDVFLVGGGGGAGVAYEYCGNYGGGGGGYTRTEKNILYGAGSYNVVVGAGGSSNGGNGGSSSFDIYSVAGGQGATSHSGGNGGSGGGAVDKAGGSDGADGIDATGTGCNSVGTGGTGQGTTTRAFEEPTGTLYSTGGHGDGGGEHSGTDGTPNTGNGAYPGTDLSNQGYIGGLGGSGIVIVRYSI